MNFVQGLQWDVTLFVLIFCRWAGMIMLAPVFGARGVPTMVKIALAASISVVVFPLIQASDPQIPTDLLLYIGVILKEIIVGIAIGFVVYLIVAIVEGAGQIIDFQMGFALGASLDPIYGLQSPMIGRFYMILATMILLATNAHHVLIAAMVRSYAFIPIMPSSLPISVEFCIQILIDVFALALQISLPVLGAVFLSEVGVGLLAKTVPQLNIFAVIFPVKIIFGFALLIASVPFFGETINMLLDKSMSYLLQLFRGWQQ